MSQHEIPFSKIAMNQNFIVNEKKESFLVDQMGFLLNHEELESFKKMVERQLIILNEQQIKEYNDRMYNQYHGHCDESVNRTERTKKKRPGFVYLIRSENNKFKIGRTANIQKRMDQLTKNVPYKIELVHFHEATDYCQFEKQMHKLFFGKRVVGEWFDLSESDILAFKNAREKHD